MKPEKIEELREKLAELAHSQWSGWMDYLFSKSVSKAGGTCMIPAWAVKRWHRQMKTPYSELSEEEKDSDRKEADDVLEMFRQHLLLDEERRAVGGIAIPKSPVGRITDLVRDLLDNSTGFISAIEIDSNVDGECWMNSIKAALDLYDSSEWETILKASYTPAAIDLTITSTSALPSEPEKDNNKED